MKVSHELEGQIYNGVPAVIFHPYSKRLYRSVCMPHPPGSAFRILVCDVAASGWSGDDSSALLPDVCSDLRISEQVSRKRR